MCEPKSRTPGIARTSRLARVTILRSSVIEVPGFVTQCIRKSLSLNVGNRSDPSVGSSASARAAADATALDPPPAFFTILGDITQSNELDQFARVDRAVAGPNDPTRLRPTYDGGDHLHPNDAGLAAIADAVDIDALLH